MNSVRPPCDLSIHLLVVLALLPILPGAASAQSEEIPENATANRYSSGWTCDRGYYGVDATCAEVVMPVNAFATNRAYGRGWQCGHGYLETDEKCVSIVVPLNAYLNSSGTDWSCDRGFRKVSDTCVDVSVPSNGYLRSSGDGWECVFSQVRCTDWI